MKKGRGFHSCLLLVYRRSHFWVSPDFCCTGIPATSREEVVKSLGEGVGLLYAENFFRSNASKFFFEGVCVLEVCSFSAGCSFALW